MSFSIQSSSYDNFQNITEKPVVTTTQDATQDATQDTTQVPKQVSTRVSKKEPSSYFIQKTSSFNMDNL